MKKRIVSSAPGGKNFLGAFSRVVPAVHEFGESFTSVLIGGEVVSRDEHYMDVADVHVESVKLAVQTKMCNGRHGGRARLGQVWRLHSEVRDKVKFLVDIKHGAYIFIFYNGVHCTKSKKGKSKLLSRKISKAGKFEIIAQELQYVYFVDIDLMHHIGTSTDFSDVQTDGRCMIHCETKVAHSRDRLFLYLNRTFLKSFLGNLPKRLHGALESSLGRNKWCVEESTTKVEFRGTAGKFMRSIPVKFIGRKNLHRILSSRLKPLTKFDLRVIDHQAELAKF